MERCKEIEKTKDNGNRCPTCRSVLPVGSGICALCSGAQSLNNGLINDAKNDVKNDPYSSRAA